MREGDGRKGAKMNEKLRAELLAELKKLDATGDGKVDIADATAIFEEIHAKAKSKLDAWIETHPVLAFHVGTNLGILCGVVASYLVLR